MVTTKKPPGPKGSGYSHDDRKLAHDLRGEAARWVARLRYYARTVPGARRAALTASAETLESAMREAEAHPSAVYRAHAYTKIGYLAIIAYNDVADSYGRSTTARKPRAREAPKTSAVYALLDSGDVKPHRVDLLAKNANCSERHAREARDAWVKKKTNP